MFMTNALYISTDGALDFFYTAQEDCVPDGPAFSYTFYVRISVEAADALRMQCKQKNTCAQRS